MEKSLGQMFLISPLTCLWRNVLDIKKKELSSGFSMWMTDGIDRRTLDFVFRKQTILYSTKSFFWVYNSLKAAVRVTGSIFDFGHGGLVAELWGNL